MNKLWAKIKTLRPPYLQLALSSLALLSVAQMLTNRALLDPIFQAPKNVSMLLNDVALGYCASWIFYLLVVLVPASMKRRQLRSWLTSRYHDLKDSLLMVYLSHVGCSWDEELITSLREPSGFASFFCGRDKPDRTRWDDVHNGLYEWGISEIQRRCQLFVADCDVAIGLIGDPSSKFLERCGMIRETLSFSSIAEPTYDDIKRLLGILFSLHCPGLVVYGEVREDRMLAAIRSL